MYLSLQDELSKVLPPDADKYRLLNILTTPRESKPIVYSQHRGHNAKVVHLISLFLDKKPLMALEVYVYLRVDESDDRIDRTIYISKADTTGLSFKHIPVGKVIEVLLKWLFLYPISKYIDDMESPMKVDHDANITAQHEPFVSETDRRLHIMIERRRSGDAEYGMPQVTELRKFTPSRELIDDTSKHVTRLVLFTRAEKQYLFPNSAENSNKHVLSDSGLLKWWLKRVDNTLDSFQSIDKKTLSILNADEIEVRRYFPSSDWKVGDVYTDTTNRNDLAVYHIPLLPDDPKGRFLEHLVIENRIKKLKLGQFWTELSVRQEFRMGITVGLIGLEGHTYVNDEPPEATLLPKAEFHKIHDIMTETDYHDPDDYLNIDRQLQERQIDFLEVEGTAAPRQAPAASSIQPVNSIMMVRSKKRKAPVPQVNNISGLVKRKK